MQLVNVDSTKYACYIHQEDNSLPYLLMLHGFMGDHRVFDHLIDDFKSFCNPITVDLLGFGASDKPAKPGCYNENNQTKELLGLIKQLKISPLILSGYSMGGRLALKTALAEPEQFSALILESTTCGIPGETDRKERRKADAARATQIEESFEQFLNSWKKLDLFQSPLPQQKELVQKYQAIQSKQSPTAVAASLKGFGTGSMSPVCDVLHKLNTPVLLMAGAADVKYQSINKYLNNQLPCSTFASIQAGHRVHIDNPTAFSKAIKEFIYKHT